MKKNPEKAKCSLKDVLSFPQKIVSEVTLKDVLSFPQKIVSEVIL